MNVNNKTGLTFALALRAFLRQDPDIIMVGEIRELETAEIAVKASHTGHLVLSTLHTNSAAETLTRLSNMGVEPFNIATSVHLIIAQRLARRLCQDCKKLDKIPEEALVRAGFSKDQIPSLKIYSPVGCDKCTHGYAGRLGIFEVLPVTQTISTLIMSGENAMSIDAQARKEGMISLRQSGLDKVLKGLTSLEEINRVSQD